MAHPDYREGRPVFELRIRVADGEFIALPLGPAATWDIARASTSSLSIRLRDRAYAEFDLEVTNEKRDLGRGRVASGTVCIGGDAPVSVLFADFIQATVGSDLLDQMICLDWSNVPCLMGGRHRHLVHVTGTSALRLCISAIETIVRSVLARQVHSLLMY